MESPEGLNKLINKVAKTSANAATEYALRVIPKISAKHAVEEISNAALVENFWSDNNDLREHNDFASFMYNKIYSEDSTKSRQDIFQELGPRVRKELGLGEKEEEEETKKRPAKKAPVAPGSRGSRRRTVVSKPEGIEAEINDLKGV